MNTQIYNGFSEKDLAFFASFEKRNQQTNKGEVERHPDDWDGANTPHPDAGDCININERIMQ